MARPHPPGRPRQQAFYSAHPTTDATTGKTFNIAIGGAKGTVEVTRFSADGSLEKSASFTPPTSLFWHDNAVTDEYVVGVTSPYVAPLKGIFGAILGFGQLGNAYKWDDTVKSEVGIVNGGWAVWYGSRSECIAAFKAGLHAQSFWCSFSPPVGCSSCCYCPALSSQAFFFSKDTLELVKRVELPGSPSSYHIVNGFQEAGKGGNVSIIIAKLRDGGREKLEDTFKNLMKNR